MEVATRLLHIYSDAEGLCGEVKDLCALVGLPGIAIILPSPARDDHLRTKFCASRPSSSLFSQLGVSSRVLPAFTASGSGSRGVKLNDILVVD